MKLVKEPYDCPNCGTRLNYQWEFDPSKRLWKCQECGQMLEHTDRIEPYMISKEADPKAKAWETKAWESDSFDDGDVDGDIYASPSNTRDGEHGEKVADGMASYLQEEEHKAGSADAEELNPEDEFDEAGMPEEVEDVDWDAEVKQETKAGAVADKHEDGAKEKKKFSLIGIFKHIGRHFKIYSALVAVIAVVIVGFTIYHHLAKMAVVGVSYEDAITMNYEEVKDILEKSGYTNIECIPLEDLESKNMDKENIVDMITVAGDSEFDATDRFLYDSEVVIQYHSAKMIKMPLDPKKVEEKTVEELENLFQKAGFENVKAEADYDLIFGVIHKEGDVEKITVDGSEKFTEQQAYRIDTEIVITYHDFKKNQKQH